MCSYWPEAVGDKQPRQTVWAALRSHCEETSHNLWEGRAAAVVKAGQEVAAKVSGRQYNYNRWKHGSSILWSHFSKGLGTRQGCITDDCDARKVYLVLSTFALNKTSVLLKPFRTSRKQDRRKNTVLASWPVPPWGICSAHYFKMNSVILKVSNIDFKAHKLSKKRW